jgi:hypothetical protein
MTILASSEPNAVPRLKTGSEYAYEDGQCRPLAGLARPLHVFLVIYAVVAGLLAAMSAYGIYDPRVLDEDVLSVVDPEEDAALLLFASAFFLVALAERALFFVCVFLVCRFSYRAMKNLYTVRSALPDMSPGAAVYWYFVPIAFWFMPVQGMSQIYHGSIAETGSPDNSRLVSYWWTAWVLSVIGSTVANSSLAPLEVTYPALMIAMAFSVVAALLLRRLVGRITEAQQSILHTGAAQVFA